MPEYFPVPFIHILSNSNPEPEQSTLYVVISIQNHLKTIICFDNPRFYQCIKLILADSMLLTIFPDSIPGSLKSKASNPVIHFNMKSAALKACLPDWGMYLNSFNTSRTRSALNIEKSLVTSHFPDIIGIPGIYVSVTL